MFYCYTCQRAFSRLRELKKHERLHATRGHCVACDVYFTTKAKEEEHRRTHHMVDAGTQTVEQRPMTQDLRSRLGGKRWRPARTTHKPQRKEIFSVAVKDDRRVTAEVSDDDDIDLNDTTSLSF